MTDTERGEIFSDLLSRDETFRKLFHDHQALEARLKEIDENRFLTDSEALERKQIQKMKLERKDRMEEILRAHRNRNVGQA